MTSYTQQIVSYHTAQALIDYSLKHAQANGWSIAAVVLDPAGHVVAAARMDGVNASILEFATDKAYTATLGKSSYALYERMHSTSSLELGLVNRPRLCVWEGGLPLYEQQYDASEIRILIGAIGVSGAEGPDDVSCAEYAITSTGLFSTPN